MTAREIYDNIIRELPAMDRLRLASLILDDITAANGAGLDIRDEWSDDDVRDLAAFSLKHAARSTPSEDANA